MPDTEIVNEPNGADPLDANVMRYEVRWKFNASTIVFCKNEEQAKWCLFTMLHRQGFLPDLNEITAFVA